MKKFKRIIVIALITFFSAGIPLYAGLDLLSDQSTIKATLSNARILAIDGTTTVPSMSFISEPGLGFYRVSSGIIGLPNNNTAKLQIGPILQYSATKLSVDTGSANSQAVGIRGKLTTSGSMEIDNFGNNGNVLLDIRGSGAQTGDYIQVNSSTGINSGDIFKINGSGKVLPVLSQITVGSGTGLTINNTGSVERVTYKVTVTFAGFSAAALTADHVIATLPAKTKLVSIYADTTIVYTGGAVSAATLIVGKTTGGNEYIVSHDVFTTVITKGLLDADLGTSINRANAIQGGDLPSFTATTGVSVRLTTVTANTNALTQGSTTFYLVTEALP